MGKHPKQNRPKSTFPGFKTGFLNGNGKSNDSTSATNHGKKTPIQLPESLQLNLNNDHDVKNNDTNSNSICLQSVDGSGGTPSESSESHRTNSKCLEDTLMSNFLEDKDKFESNHNDIKTKAYSSNFSTGRSGSTTTSSTRLTQSLPPHTRETSKVTFPDNNNDLAERFEIFDSLSESQSSSCSHSESLSQQSMSNPNSNNSSARNSFSLDSDTIAGAFKRLGAPFSKLSGSSLSKESNASINSDGTVSTNEENQKLLSQAQYGSTNSSTVTTSTSQATLSKTRQKHLLRKEKIQRHKNHLKLEAKKPILNRKSLEYYQTLRQEQKAKRKQRLMEKYNLDSNMKLKADDHSNSTDLKDSNPVTVNVNGAEVTFGGDKLSYDNSTKVQETQSLSQSLESDAKGESGGSNTQTKNLNKDDIINNNNVNNDFNFQNDIKDSESVTDSKVLRKTKAQTQNKGQEIEEDKLQFEDLPNKQSDDSQKPSFSGNSNSSANFTQNNVKIPITIPIQSQSQSQNQKNQNQSFRTAQNAYGATDLANSGADQDHDMNNMNQNDNHNLVQVPQQYKDMNLNDYTSNTDHDDLTTPIKTSDILNLKPSSTVTTDDDDDELTLLSNTQENAATRMPPRRPTLLSTLRSLSRLTGSGGRLRGVNSFNNNNNYGSSGSSGGNNNIRINGLNNRGNNSNPDGINDLSILDICCPCCCKWAINKCDEKFNLNNGTKKTCEVAILSILLIVIIRILCLVALISSPSESEFPNHNANNSNNNNHQQIHQHNQAPGPGSHGARYHGNAGYNHANGMNHQR